MRIRVLVAVLVALAVGAGAGWWIAAARTPGAVAFEAAAPIAATRPSYPTTEVRVRPDPPGPTLQPGVRLGAEGFRYLDYRFRLPVPASPWQRFSPDFPPGRWTYAVPGVGEDGLLPYRFRIDLLVNRNQSVGATVAGRVGELTAAQLDGNIADLEVERLADGFTADYVAADRTRQVTIQRFLPAPDDPGLAYVTIAVTGRERDRAGLVDLLDRATADGVVVLPADGPDGPDGADGADGDAG